MRALSPALVLALALAPLAAGCVTVRAATTAGAAPPGCCTFAWSRPETRTRRERDFERSAAGELVRARIARAVGSSRVDLQACKLEYSIVSPK